MFALVLLAFAAPPSWSTRPPVITRAEIAAPEANGTSGLARDGAGRYVAIPERGERLLVFTATAGGRPVLDTELRIEGVPPGLDLESLAWAGGDRFAIGTESLLPERRRDRILLAKRGPRSLRVTGTLRFEYGPFGVAAAVNQGIEGLCLAGEVLLAAAETTGRLADGRRFAPLGARDLARRRWSAYRIPLSTETGKISALACRVSRSDPSLLEVLAIERHYAIVRVLGFTLPRAPSPKPREPIDVAAEVLLDLGPLLGPRPPNLEALEWSGEDELIALSDNEYGTVSGPTIVLFIR